MFKIGVVEFDYGHDSGGAAYGTQTVYQVEINPGSLAEANAMRYQLLGQRGKIVGVSWADDPMVDGLYIQRDCSVSPIANYLAHGRMSANVVLERVQPEIEAHHEITFFTGNAPDNFYASAVHGVYDLDDASSGTAVWHDSGDFFLSNTLSVDDGGGLSAILPVAYKPWENARQTLHVAQAVDPALLDVGRARIEVNGGDEAGWWTLEGTTVPEGVDLRVSNGLLRLTLLAGTTYMAMEEWVGGEWVGSARYTVLLNPDATTGATFLPRWEIISNERASVYVRCVQTRGSGFGKLRKFAIDLQLFRGVPTISVVPNRAIRPDTNFTSIALEMSEYDGTNMSTSAWNTDNLRRDAEVSANVRPYLFQGFWDSYPTPTVSTTLDTVSYATVSYAMFSIGGIDGEDYFEAKYLVSDRLVR